MLKVLRICRPNKKLSVGFKVTEGCLPALAFCLQNKEKEQTTINSLNWITTLKCKITENTLDHASHFRTGQIKQGFDVHIIGRLCVFFFQQIKN